MPTNDPIRDASQAKIKPPAHIAMRYDDSGQVLIVRAPGAVQSGGDRALDLYERAFNYAHARIAALEAELAKVTAERDAMAEVVKAAEAWRSNANPPACDNLAEAVDAWRKGRVG